jgi:hypothetical protein
VRRAQENKDERESALLAWERLWEIFLAPHVGALATAHISNEAATYLSTLVSQLDKIRNSGDFDSITAGLCDEKLFMTALTLADELIYGYATTVHSKFREHKFHEWLCSEFARARRDDNEAGATSGVPRLPEGCIKRLLRKAAFPVGVAPHKPFVQAESEIEATTTAKSVDQVNAECAVIFGTRVGLFDSNPALTDDSHGPLRRYACETLNFGHQVSSALSLEEIPPTLESYAVIPSTPESSQSTFRQYRDGQWIR